MSTSTTRDGLIIGIDAGTSVIKAVAFDLEGRQVGIASTPNRVILGADGGAEQDLEVTWQNTVSTLKALAEQLPKLDQRCLAIAATGQGDGTWLIDADGHPVGKAMLWLDGRATPQVRAQRAGPHAQTLAELTGTALNPSMQSAQMLWLAEHYPERLRLAATAMHCKDWLYFRFTGERATSPCEGSFTFGNWRTHRYDETTLQLLGLSEWQRLLPPLIDGTRHYMPLTAEAAAACGLRSGTPVVLPMMDVPATVLGSGGVAFDGARMRRVGCSILGSTGMHGWVSNQNDDIVPSAEAGYTMAMALPNARARLMSHMAATLNIDWLLSLLSEAIGLADAQYPGKTALVQRLNDMVLQASPAQALFHPYVADNGERGPFVDGDARAQLSGFNTTLGLSGMARAVFEGICLAARDCYAALGDLPTEIRLSGGAARSVALRQLLASVTGRPVRISHREECGAAGAAICAAVALGIHASVRDALPQWVDAWLDAETTAPDEQQVALYNDLFSVYRQMTSQARPVWRDLATVRAAHR